MRILFVLNPRSGSGKHERSVETVRVYCEENRLEYKIQMLEQDKNEQQLAELIDSYSPNAVVACGGDGTVNFVASLLLGKPILFSILPMGSANGLAAALGITMNVKLVLERVAIGNYVKMDVLRINDQYNCFHLSSLGLNATLVKKYEVANGKGMWGYAKHFISTFAEKKPKKYIFDLNSTIISKHAEMVTFANAKKYGTGAVVNPDGKVDDGKFEICIFHPFPWHELFRMTYYFFLGNLKNSPLVKILRTSTVKVSCEGKETLEVDGDVVGRYDEIHVSIQKGALRMVVGEM